MERGRVEAHAKGLGGRRLDEARGAAQRRPDEGREGDAEEVVAAEKDITQAASGGRL